ncbi:D-glycero-beta-D-manno-heptose 1,7-bisphosphate 7-phosphatase [Ferrimonas sediminicola]|uniref:D,D-heptose 1,7-bisphosphate phosphatase n=1 Tax=Ferrimonas sediminicola TaxID=2569538 RepID=A0A4U1BDH4_9GAMM|nr:D-glycero-beta-D-manno-heptose 1,7-bisphosphate 7-phosphatase [Ferrimonas sediminicola]TKB48825.1 D-glycero-beta-D-manno-heptose 1,7-bisphosphate 7-phosphatase [Ferrimonas sediminicola]
MRKAVFLDRDGVINRDHGYVHTIEEFEFIPGTLQACARLSQAGYQLVVVTNQSGIARGYYDEGQFRALSQWMGRQFAEAGAPLLGVYFCPHHPEKGLPKYVGECECRKPNPGMLLQAAEEHDLDLANSVMIGDKDGDIEAGRRAGVATCIQVCSGKPVDGSSLPDWIADDLAGAADWLLGKK